MKVGAYARVSTSDKDQNPETQLVALRDFARLHKWEIVGEFVDHAPANDPLHRTAWRKLLDDAAKRRFQAVLVFKLDRVFRSVKHMHDTLAVWEAQGIGFVSAREGFNTNTALGRLLMNLLASLAEFELEVLSERVKAGMDRARRQGVHIGRPPGAGGVRRAVGGGGARDSCRAPLQEPGRAAVGDRLRDGPSPAGAGHQGGRRIMSRRPTRPAGLRVNYDPEADALYLEFRDSVPEDTIDLAPRRHRRPRP